MKRLTSLFLTLLIIMTGWIEGPHNLEAQNGPTLQLSSTSVQAGQRARIYIQSRHVEDLAGFQIQIFYNPEAMSIAQSFTYSYTSSRGSSVINTSERGVVSLSFVGTTPLSGSATLFFIEFDIKSDANIQNYPLLMGVQEAINSDLNPISLYASNGHIEVTEAASTLRSIPLSTSVNRSRMEMGDRFTYSLNLNHSILKSAGSFDVFYDDEILQLVDTTVGTLPSQSQSITTVNDQFRGRIHFTFISLNGLNSVWPLVTLEFEVIKDVQASTNIQVVPIQVLDMDLQPLQASTHTRAVQITKKPPTFNIPSVFVESKTLTTIDDFHLDLKVEENSQLAIGVFEVTYNPYLVKLTEVEMINENDTPNILTLYTHQAEEGRIKLTYLNPQGLTALETIARLHFSPLQNETSIHTQVEVKVEQLLNANYQTIRLASRNAQVHLSNQYQVKIYHQDELLQDQMTDNLEAINYPVVELEAGQRFAFWEPTIQGQTITYQSRVYRLGDINDDGTIDMEDLTLFRNALAGNSNFTPLQLRAANLIERNSIKAQTELTLKDILLLQLRIQEQAQQNND